MKHLLIAFTAAVALLVVAGSAMADWNVGDPYKMHWPQLPDLQTGLDVLATTFPQAVPPWGKALADDFKCTQTGQITDIHIWGSWLNNIFPLNTDPAGVVFPDPGNVRFRLSLHANIPDPDGATGPDFSKPGDELWSGWFGPGQFKWRRQEVPTERFMNPNIPPDQNQIIGFDNQVVQYNFYPDPLDPRLKQEAGTIYWLDVTAIPLGIPDGPGSEAWFGWKTTRPELHFEDDAVYGHMRQDALGNWVSVGDWLPLKYPMGGEFEGQTMDLSFVITPEPGTVAMLVGAGLIGLVAYARRRRMR
jgi:hypothetical protein